MHSMPSTRDFSAAQRVLAAARCDAKHALRRSLEAANMVVSLYDQMALAYRARGNDSGAAYAEDKMREYEAKAESIKAFLTLFPRG